MHVELEYAQTIIVGVIKDKRWSWYITDKDIWILDLTKYTQAFIKAGYEVPDPDDHSDRYNLAVVNAQTANTFLNFIANFKVSALILRERLTADAIARRLPEDEWYKYNPSLLVDFDRCRLVSNYPEPFGFEKYVPDGWVGEADSFLDEVPIEERFWLVEGDDYFARLWYRT